MPEGGFFEQRRARPSSFALVVLLHAGVLGAVIMIKGPIAIPRSEPIDTYFVPIPPDPEPEPQLREPRPSEQPSVIERTQRVIDRPTDQAIIDDRPTPPLPPVGRIGPEPIPEPRPVPPPPPPPVRTEAEFDPRFIDALQPPYPPSEQRAEREGTVRLRVTIGADGRVKAVEKLSATSDAFWQASERHARARWRFRPATLDGRAVESRKVVSLTFRLQDA